MGRVCVALARPRNRHFPPALPRGTCDAPAMAVHLRVDSCPVREEPPDGLSLTGVGVRHAKPEQRPLRDALVDAHHYPGFRRLADHGLCCAVTCFLIINAPVPISARPVRRDSVVVEALFQVSDRRDAKHLVGTPERVARRGCHQALSVSKDFLPSWTSRPSWTGRAKEPGFRNSQG